MIERKENKLFNIRQHFGALFIAMVFFSAAALLSSAYHINGSPIDANPFLQPLSAKVDEPLSNFNSFAADAGNTKADNHNPKTSFKTPEIIAAEQYAHKTSETLKTPSSRKERSLSEGDQIAAASLEINKQIKQWQGIAKQCAFTEKEANQKLLLPLPQIKELTVEQVKNLANQIRETMVAVKEKSRIGSRRCKRCRD